MGILQEYVTNKEYETAMTTGLMKQFGKLSRMREVLSKEISIVTKTLNGLNSELVTIDDMLFEIKERLDAKGIDLE